MKSFKTMAYIYKGKMQSTEIDEVEILKEIADNQYKCNYNDKICLGIFN